MNLLMLSITMILVLILAIYAMTRGQAIENEIQRLVDTKPLEQIYDEYRSNNFGSIRTKVRNPPQDYA